MLDGPTASVPTPPRSPSRWTRLGLAGLAAVGMVLACPTVSIWWLGFFAWIPMFAAIDGTSPRASLFYGWVTGCITVFWGFFWLTELLTRFAEFPMSVAAVVAFLFASYHGLLWGLAAWITTRLAKLTPECPLWVTAPLAWVAIEGTLPNIFPIHMALAWSWQPLWIQTAELGSVTMVAGIMVALNAGLYTMLKSYAQRRQIDRPAAIAVGLLLLGVPGYGAIRIARVKQSMTEAPHLKIGVVQGNMSIKEMGVNAHRARILAEQQRVSAELEADGAELLIWGETSYPHGRMFSKQDTEEPSRKSSWRIHRGFRAPALVGVVTRDATGTKKYPFNTAMLFDGDGKIIGSYDKVYRLIFGEYIPVIDPDWYLEMVPSASHLDPGPGPQALPFGQYRLGPFICYEDILARYVRQTAMQNVHVFVNLTNDAWFGKTAEPAQHLGLAVFRAVEHRKAMVRAVNTGVSAYVDPTGFTAVQTRVSDPDNEGPQPAEGFVVNVPMMDPEHRTLYGRTGETFNVLCILGVVGIGFRGSRRRRSASPSEREKTAAEFATDRDSVSS